MQIKAAKVEGPPQMNGLEYLNKEDFHRGRSKMLSLKQSCRNKFHSSTFEGYDEITPMQVNSADSISRIVTYHSQLNRLTRAAEGSMFLACRYSPINVSRVRRILSVKDSIW